MLQILVQYKTVYIEPGHGLKGKKAWPCNDSALKAMYNAHNGKASNFGVIQKQR